MSSSAPTVALNALALLSSVEAVTSSTCTADMVCDMVLNLMHMTC